MSTGSFKLWTKDEIERLVRWMEDNQELLRGRQNAWHKQAKEELFSNEEHITVKKIREKATNMKRAWKEAKAMQEHSGWGLRYEDNQSSINERLEKKCRFFWRLDAVWGPMPNATATLTRESTSRSAGTPPVGASATTLQEDIEEDMEEDTHMEEDTQLDWPPSPGPARPTRPSRAPYTSSQRPEKLGLNAMLQQVLINKQIAENELAEKRLQAEINAQIEVARIQADAQVRQMEIFARMMQDVLAATQGGSRSGHGGGSGDGSGGGI